MSRKELPNPRLTFGKAIKNALLLWAIFSFMSFVHNAIFALYTTGTPEHSLVTDILFGSGFLLLSLWSLWAWQPRRKYARWHRWLVSQTGVIYVSVLILLGGVSSWNSLLQHPWNWIVNSILVMLFIIVCILPALSYRWSKKIAKAQDTLGLNILSYGGTGSLMVLVGILGSIFGRAAYRGGKLETAIWVFGFMWPLVAIFLAQYNANKLWAFRPWAKEEE